jgi:hypothetical protein
MDEQGRIGQCRQAGERKPMKKVVRADWSGQAGEDRQVRLD